VGVLKTEVRKMYPVICAWCGKKIGECVVEHSHGICPRCKDKMLAEAMASTEAEQREQVEVSA
jgi:DNA-directed RNA polymerase subunit RPC12/RpoP